MIADIAKNWILQNVCDAIVEMSQQFLTAFANSITDIFTITTNFNNNYLKDIDAFTSGFAIAIIIFLTVKQYFTTYVLETSGDPQADPIDIYVRAAQAIVMATCSSIIFDWFLDFSQVFVSDLQNIEISGGAEAGNMADVLIDILSIPANLASVPIVIILIGVSLTIAFVVFFIMAGIRAGELLLMKMLFPIFACDLTTTNRERFNSFFTSFIVTWLAYGIQLVCFKMYCTTIVLYLSCDVTEFSLIFAVNIGWMFLMFKSPRWIEKFCYSSGIGNTISGTLRTLPFVLRAIR